MRCSKCGSLMHDAFDVRHCHCQESRNVSTSEKDRTTLRALYRTLRAQEARTPTERQRTATVGVPVG